MRIAVLDGYALNPGDLSWDPLKALGDCAIHDRTPPEDVVQRAANAELALTNKTVLDAAALAQLDRLRYIGVLATGYNVVDVDAARDAGIVVTNVPAYSTSSVAQLVFALLLELCHHVGDHPAGAHAGKWTRSKDFCYWDHALTELDGLTMGVVGYGRIGRRVVGVARAFGMRVMVNTRTVPEPRPEGVEFVDIDTLFRRADVVSLHCPLTPETHAMVNAGRLALMKKTAFLINTGRGPLVDDRALADAVNSNAIAGAGVDVLSSEPPQPDNPLLGAAKCLITPHLAWATRASRSRLMGVAVANVKAFLDGRPVNVVS